MIPLSVNYSQGLLELIQAGQAPIQAIEFGPWYLPPQISEIRKQIPSLPFHFHHSNLIPQLKWFPGTYNRLRAYLACTETPWISAHISMLLPGYARFAQHTGWYLPSLPAALSFRWFIKGVHQLQQRTTLPILLENMPSFPSRQYAHEVDPVRIRQVLDETGAGFLLDLAHARTVASVFQWDIYDYLQKLPLERTVQIHISGPRVRQQVLQDAHEPMQAEDYQLLEWAMQRTQPQIVTLEYFKDKQALANQLFQLSSILSRSVRTPAVKSL